MRARRLYHLPSGPSEERTRLWRSILDVERALDAMVARGDRSDEVDELPAPDDRLQAARNLRDAYRGARRLERCLLRCEEDGVRALIVSEAPCGREAPFDGPSGARLADLLGVDRLDEIAERANLLTDDEVERGASIALLRERASRISTKRRVVLACGRSVAAAFGIDDDVPFLAWRWSTSGAAVMVLPHPSGRNRWWNDEENRAAAERAIGWIGQRLKKALAATT